MNLALLDGVPTLPYADLGAVEFGDFGAVAHNLDGHRYYNSHAWSVWVSVGVHRRYFWRLWWWWPRTYIPRGTSIGLGRIDICVWWMHAPSWKRLKDALLVAGLTSGLLLAAAAVGVGLGMAL